MQCSASSLLSLIRNLAVKSLWVPAYPIVLHRSAVQPLDRPRNCNAVTAKRPLLHSGSNLLSSTPRFAQRRERRLRGEGVVGIIDWRCNWHPRCYTGIRVWLQLASEILASEMVLAPKWLQLASEMQNWHPRLASELLAVWHSG